MSQPIRTLQIFTIMDRGGAETNIMNYYRKLDRSKFQFDFIVHREKIGAYESEIIELGGKITRFLPFNPFKNKAYKKQISNFFDHNDYKIIHGNCSELGYYIYKEASKRNIPVIIAHAHNATDGWNLKSPFRWYYKNKMRSYVNTYFSCGNLASIWLFGKKNAPKAFTMSNAIDTNNFRYNNAKDLLMRQNLDCENSTNLLHVGRFCAQKNHTFLIDIFVKLIKINPNSKLFLVGDGGEFQSTILAKVKKLELQEKIIFLGSRSDVNEIAQAMDIFLFPSLFEGLPVSLVEAQAAGLKCIISDGVPEESILIPNNVEVISLQKSSKYWAEKITAFTNHRKTDVSQIITDKKYDINANVIILENKYSELLKINS